MSNFILPITIENRKVVLLDLFPKKKSEEDFFNSGDDTYIVELPVADSNIILSVNKLKKIQSLIGAISDIAIRNLNFKVSFNENILKIVMNDKDSSGVGSKIKEEKFTLSEGFSLRMEEDDTQLNILLQKHPVFSAIESDQLLIQFVLEIDDYVAVALVTFFLAERSSIKYLGLDFGSEASQMHIGERKGTATIKNEPVALFDAVKAFYNETEKEDIYEQFDGDSSLYKSKFYIEKVIDPHQANDSLSESLKLITTKREVGLPVFFQNWYLVPNLKLFHGNPEYAKKITFQIKSSNHILTFSFLKNKIYTALLQNILSAYFTTNFPNEKQSYLRFTLLTPNIYTIQEIIELKRTIRKIFESTVFKVATNIKAIEIENLSESDASFIGCLKHIHVQKGKYYIIIDCGKGTTDFSILQAEKGTQLIFKPIYRNGFAGAGNLISFGLLQSSLEYIFNLYKNDEEGLKNARSYFRKVLSIGHQTVSTYRLYEAVENWKKNFGKQSKVATEGEWEKTKSGARTVSNIFSDDDSPQGVEDLLSKINHAYDWGGYVEDSISDIIKRVYNNLLFAVQQMNKENECGGVLLTGRAFYFKPLKDAMLNKLRSMPGMEKLHCLNDGIEMNLKEVCLDGVFERSIITHCDIASTPFQIEKGTMKQLVKVSKNQNRFFQIINRLIKNQILKTEEIESYDEESNSLKVISPDLINCLFMSSGKILKSSWNGNVAIEEAHLMQARSGIYLRLRDVNTKESVVPLEESNMNSNIDTQKLVIRSLFPGYSDISTFDIF